MITRLLDDIGTTPVEMERGDVPKTIQCYMKETGVFDKEAQEYTMFLINETWKNLNGEPIEDSPFSQDFITCSINMGRVTHYVYQHGDEQCVQGPDDGSQLKHGARQGRIQNLCLDGGLFWRGGWSTRMVTISE
ncbi:hypothetical protein BUALT_Bualt13G0037800 [Buddleja alternifolia]|uniref:Terpene synthase metal-binding domain-containing protein n=1 Tax=Buddleja alternifolia TaxID=168488 RepID=A0AAV6WK76_9LAMI|nr:hypothetical protein BUALT_Bualt13G0037800 [Buddleja alternifolia]